MNELGLWKTQANFNENVIEEFTQLAKQVRILTYGLISTTAAVALLTLGIIVK